MRFHWQCSVADLREWQIAREGENGKVLFSMG